MLAEEKRTIKLIVEYERKEYESLVSTLDIIDFLIENFESELREGMGSIATGEYISKFDLYKVKGVINGLLTNTEWLLEEV